MLDQVQSMPLTEIGNSTRRTLDELTRTLETTGATLASLDAVLEQEHTERLPEELVIHHDSYSDVGAAELIEDYDTRLGAFYESQGRNLDTAAWTGPLARGSKNLRFASLRDDLDSLGFDFG